MNKLSKLLLSSATAAGMFLLNPLSAFAADDVVIQPGLGFEKLGNITVTSLVSGGIRLVLVLAALVFFFILVIGGIQWIISGGDKTGVETARKRITNALIGLAIVFVAWAIISLINTLFGVNITSLSVPQLYK